MLAKKCVIDIETDGFDPTKIHCLWVKEIEDGVTSLGRSRRRALGPMTR